MIEVKVPVLPESISEATVAVWHKKPGDFVELDDVIVEIETDKVVLEVPAEDSGVLTEIRAKEGETVGEQQVLGILEKKPQDDSKETPTAESDSTKKEEPTQEAPEEVTAEQEVVPLSNLETMKKAELVELAASLNVQVEGKTTKAILIDRINTAQSGQEEATQKAPEKVTQEVPEKVTLEAQKNSPELSDKEDLSPKGNRLEERVPMSRIRKTIANRLHSATQNTAMLTTFNEVDMSSILSMRSSYKEAFEKKYSVKLGLMSFFVKAAVESLKKFPTVNAYIDGDDIVYHAYCDVSVAISSDRGLVVPVLRDAHKMAMHDIEKAIIDFAVRAQDGTLGIDEMSGGTFTISNGGVFGSLLSTPILNSPQSAILGMHKTQERPIVVDGEIVIRPMMYLALSYDHQIIDGKEAVQFLISIKDALEDPTRLLLKV
jgi:2-oxoglutarate dehydrogenase E2 component (dihydrolipoamide succinyltransferase)